VFGSLSFIASTVNLYVEHKSNYAFKPIAEQALRSKQSVVPQRLNAALDLRVKLPEIDQTELSLERKVDCRLGGCCWVLVFR